VPLDDHQYPQCEDADAGGGHDGRRCPAEIRALDQGEHHQGDAQSGAERAGQVEAALGLGAAVGGDQPERQQHRDGGQRHVHEEHRLPAERLGQDTAQQHAEHEPGGARTAPDRHRPVARSAFGEGGIDQRQGGGKDERSADALCGAGDEQEHRARREPAGERAARVEHEARHEHPAPSHQVGGAAAEEQEAGGRHRVGADHRLQCVGRVAQVASDVGQRHHHDVLIERDDQHREGEQRQRRALAWPPSGGQRPPTREGNGTVWPRPGHGRYARARTDPSLKPGTLGPRTIAPVMAMSRSDGQVDNGARARARRGGWRLLGRVVLMGLARARPRGSSADR
jgi:hypothetical protein